MRKYGLNRWNWSSKAQKWVYVTKKNNKRVYKYQIEPPEEFIALTNQLKDLNHKLMEVKDHEENKKLFRELMELSKKMQAMREP